MAPFFVFPGAFFGPLNYEKTHTFCNLPFFRANFGADFGTKFGTDFGTKFGTDFGTKFGTEFGTKFGALFRPLFPFFRGGSEGVFPGVQFGPFSGGSSGGGSPSVSRTSWSGRFPGVETRGFPRLCRRSETPHTLLHAHSVSACVSPYPPTYTPARILCCRRRLLHHTPTSRYSGGCGARAVREVVCSPYTSTYISARAPRHVCVVSMVCFYIYRYRYISFYIFL